MIPIIPFEPLFSNTIVPRPFGFVQWRGHAFGIPRPVWASSFTDGAGGLLHNIGNIPGKGVMDVTASFWRANEEGIGYYIDGATDNTDHIALPALGISGATARTVYCRLILRDGVHQAAGQTIFAWGNVGPTKSFYGVFYDVEADGRNEKFSVAYGGRSWRLDSTSPRNVVHSLFTTYNSGNVEDASSTAIWLNGVNQGISTTGSTTGTAATDNEKYYLARDQDPTSGFRAPEADYLDFAVWDEVLTDAQITWISANPNLLYWQPNFLISSPFDKNEIQLNLDAAIAQQNLRNLNLNAAIEKQVIQNVGLDARISGLFPANPDQLDELAIRIPSRTKKFIVPAK
jgi:hypothetical protein